MDDASNNRITGDVVSVDNVANYRVVKRIGEGLCSDVYMGISVLGGEHVAIKILKPQPGYDMVMMREVGVLKQLKNIENIVNMYHTTVHRKRGCIITECLDMNIRQLISKNRRRGFMPYTLLKFAREVLTGLNEIHQKGFCHGDLKASNVMWSGRSGCFKIIDFSHTLHATADFRLIHSTGYRAPEVVDWGAWKSAKRSQLRTDRQSAGEPPVKPGIESDIWAFGVLLYEASFGSRYFKDDLNVREERDNLEKALRTEVDYSFAIAEYQYEQLNEFIKELKEVLIMCIKESPKERATIASLLQMPFFQQFNPEPTRRDNQVLVSPILVMTAVPSPGNSVLALDTNFLKEECAKHGSVVRVLFRGVRMFVEFYNSHEAQLAYMWLSLESLKRTHPPRRLSECEEPRAVMAPPPPPPPVESQDAWCFVTEYYPLHLWRDLCNSAAES